MFYLSFITGVYLEMAFESGRDWIDRLCGALLGQRAGPLTLRLVLSIQAIFGLSVQRGVQH